MLKYTQVGAITGSFTPGNDNTSFLDYLSGIESTKHMFTQLLNKEGQNQHSLYAINQEPDLVVTRRSSASTRTSHFSANGQRKAKRADREDDDNDSDDGEESETPPKSKRRNTTKDQEKPSTTLMNRRYPQVHHRGRRCSSSTAARLLNIPQHLKPCLPTSDAETILWVHA